MRSLFSSSLILSPCTSAVWLLSSGDSVGSYSGWTGCTGVCSIFLFFGGGLGDVNGFGGLGHSTRVGTAVGSNLLEAMSVGQL